VFTKDVGLSLVMEEKEWVRFFEKRSGKRRGSTLVGIGDDAAVYLSPKVPTVVTVDCLVENTHFSFPEFEASEVGEKALAVNLSDLAAMGAVPDYALISLGIPPGKKIEKHVRGLYRGIHKVAKQHRVEILGGNLTRTDGPLFVDITAIGHLQGKAAVLRSGAKPGDQIAVLGKLGEASAGLFLLQRLGRKRAMKEWSELVRAQTRPHALVKEGAALGSSGKIRAMMDVSDGLSTSLHTLAEASKVAIEIDFGSLPFSNALKRASVAFSKSPSDWVLNGGEDYALLFTYPAAASPWIRQHFPEVCPLGTVRKGRGVFMVSGKQRKRLLSGGFDHFR
jgi:thiamine-monophosphate kinase